MLLIKLIDYRSYKINKTLTTNTTSMQYIPRRTYPIMGKSQE